MNPETTADDVERLTLELAQSRAETQAAQERAQAAAEEVAALRGALAAAGGGGAQRAPLAPARIFSALSGALAHLQQRVVESPTKMGAPSIQDALACMDVHARPLAPDLLALSVAPSLQCWLGTSPGAMLQEVSAYPIATAFVPPWIVAQPRPAHRSKGAQSASTLFLAGGGVPLPTLPGASVVWSSKPELLTAPRHLFHPGFTGEIKSATSANESSSEGKLFDELLTNGLLAMLGSYFQGVPPGCHRFFLSPPRAYALAGLSHAGYLVALEWAGKVLGCVVSEPFFLGSPAHQAAVARLPDCNQAAPGSHVDLHLDGIGVAAWPEAQGEEPRVIWRVAPPSGAPTAAPSSSSAAAAAPFEQGFFKVLPGTAFEAPYFRALHAAYTRLAAARAEGDAVGDPAPPAIVPAQLLYGAGQVGVFMPWVDGARCATRSDLCAGGVALEPLADAMAWLARRALLYIDVREPNVLVRTADGSVALIDYDDLVCLDAPPASGKALCAALLAEGAHCAAAPGQPGALPELMGLLRARYSPP